MSSSSQTATAARPLPVVSSSPPPAAEEHEERTSNEVDGFTYSRFKGLLYTLAILLKLPFIPLWPFFIAYESRDWSIARDYFGTLGYSFRVVVAHIRFGSFLRMIKYNLLLSPKVVQDQIMKRRGACSRCAKCCKQFECIFLGKDDEGEHYCKIYRTSYWYYGTCGRYPLEQVDIDFHACPGFSFAPEDAVI